MPDPPDPPDLYKLLSIHMEDFSFLWDLALPRRHDKGRRSIQLGKEKSARGGKD
jgi:hypothetical protein